MIKKIALVGLFAGVSMVSAHRGWSPSSESASAPRAAVKVEAPILRGGPCLPGVPRC